VGEQEHLVAVVGGGVIGCAVALALARRRMATVLLEREPELALAASGTNSGILHTGFDSVPGELETDLILRSARLRAPLVETLAIPILRCGAVLRPRGAGERETARALADNAGRNGVEVAWHEDGSLSVPGESVTDPVAYTLTLAAAAQRAGAEVRTGWSVDGFDDGPVVRAAGGEALPCTTVVNCAGLRADEVARAAGDDSFAIYPRKGEFFVFDAPLDRIYLPVPTKRTKGVLVFPTLDGRTVAGPTAVDVEDKDDWRVRAEAREEVITKAAAIHPPLRDAEPIAAYAGLRPAGRGVNYVIGRSATVPWLVNVAAIRSTGLTASPGIAEHVAGLVAPGRAEVPLRAGPRAARASPWWRRTAAFRRVA
jgi:glycerol-3-phosphate dehydrogenase